MEKIGQFGEYSPGILFGSVHEDVATEARIASRLPAIRRAFVIGSGGDTALRIAPLVSERVDAFDDNPAQVWLCKLRQRALIALDEEGYDRFARLHGASELFDSALPVWEAPLHGHGADFSGRIEIMLGRMRRLLHAAVCSRARLTGILAENDPARRLALAAPWLKSWRWRIGMRILISPISLARKFAPGWVKQIPPGFAAAITRQICASLRARGPSSAPLWRLLVGPSAEASNPMRGGLFDSVKQSAGRIRFECGDAFGHLASSFVEYYQFVALSNILEGTSVERALPKLESARHALSPGGLLVLRSIFASFPDAIPGFEREAALELEMEPLDGSPVCRAFRVYRRR